MFLGYQHSPIDESDSFDLFESIEMDESESSSNTRTVVDAGNESSKGGSNNVKEEIEKYFKKKEEAMAGSKISSNKRKRNNQKRMEGTRYEGKKKVEGGKILDAVTQPRSFGEPCEKKHKKFKNGKKLCSSITEEERLGLFKKFWNMDWGQKKVYISSLVTIKPAQRRGKFRQIHHKKNNTFCYHLRISDKNIRVCKEMFLSTFGLGEWSVQNWVKTSNDGMHPSSSKLCKKKSFISSFQNVSDFLSVLPKMKSHYCRKHTTKLYLEPSFRGMSELYRAYTEYCSKTNDTSVASITTLRNTFREKNLSFYKPRKDRCDICTQFEENNLDDASYRKHIQMKDQARAEKDKAKFSDDSNVAVLAVDLEAVLLAPNLQASSFYFKTKLACHNYTIFNLHTNLAACYFWHEGEGDLSADALASCLLHYLTTNEHCIRAKEIIIYSDGCTYQNRNKLLSNTLLHFCNFTGKTITQKYLEKGHTQMECDSVHAACERAVNKRKIYLPHDYLEFIKNAKKDRSYDVKYVTHEFFSSFQNLDYYQSIRPGSRVGDPVVTDIRLLKYSHGEITFK